MFLSDVAEFARGKDKVKRKSRGYIGAYRGLTVGEKAGVATGATVAGVGGYLLGGKGSLKRKLTGAALVAGGYGGALAAGISSTRRKNKMGYKFAQNPFRKDS